MVNRAGNAQNLLVEKQPDKYYVPKQSNIVQLFRTGYVSVYVDREHLKDTLMNR